MTMTRFQDLCDGVCALVEAPPFEVGGSLEGCVAFHLVRRGVTINMMYFQHSCEDHAFMVFEFGQIPLDDPRASRIMLALLDNNFLAPDAHPPALGRNPVSGDIVLRTVFPLATTTAEAALVAMDRGADLALEWRAGFFLEPEPILPAFDVLAPGSLA